MDETSKITYGGDFVQNQPTAPQGPTEDATEYVGNDMPPWSPTVSPEPELTPDGS